MKIKYIFIVLFIFILCGCTNIKNESIENILNNINKKAETYNVLHTGYKYYLPAGLSETNFSTLNSVIESDYFKMYLYIDGVSYINKVKYDFKGNKDAYYSTAFKYDEKDGYLNITLKENNQYLIEIMFNYAKIEVMVDESDINLALNYAVSILGSIEYSDNVIENMLGEDVLNYQEEVYNIFNTTSSDSDYLKRVIEEEKAVENEVTDTDLLN